MYVDLMLPVPSSATVAVTLHLHPHVLLSCRISFRSRLSYEEATSPLSQGLAVAAGITAKASPAAGQAKRQETLTGTGRDGGHRQAPPPAHLSGATEKAGLVLLVEGHHGAYVLLRHQLRAQPPVRHGRAALASPRLAPPALPDGCVPSAAAPPAARNRRYGGTRAGGTRVAAPGPPCTAASGRRAAAPPRRPAPPPPPSRATPRRPRGGGAPRTSTLSVRRRGNLCGGLVAGTEGAGRGRWL